MKKTAARLTLDLDPTIDILAEVGQKKGDRLLIGFAAETQNLIDEARRKLKTKNCDMVVGNNVSRDDVGFGSDENEVVLVLRTGENVEIPRASKRQVADAIFDHALRLRLALFRHAAP
jgi:phosphopantothenoylcysteine decarboxylase/phosphopantothenate--cysteine ligase